MFPRLEVIISKEKPAENKEENVKLTEEERKTLIEIMDNQKKAFLNRRRNKWKRRRNFFAGRRKGGYLGIKPLIAYSAKRTSYGWRRFAFNNIKKPFGKSPTGRRNNMRKFFRNRKNSGNKPFNAKN